jgi:GNAT superfamily N-acetyltransferase
MNMRPTVQVAPGDPFGPAARHLVAEMIAEIPRRYGETLDGAALAQRTERLLAAHAVFAGERGAFMVATVKGEVAVCGALAPLEGDTGEVKRMFVRQPLRRCGVATAILAALEQCGLLLGYRRLRLETGDRQPEAQALYAQAGYVHIEPFGVYAGDPTSVCFEKVISQLLTPTIR